MPPQIHRPLNAGWRKGLHNDVEGDGMGFGGIDVLQGGAIRSASIRSIVKDVAQTGSMCFSQAKALMRRWTTPHKAAGRKAKYTDLGRHLYLFCYFSLHT